MKNYWISTLSRFGIGLAFVLLAGFALPWDDIYDQKGYYLFPIRPGEVNYLSGTMGELRATHFHAGIDIKTSGREGLAVYAAADGYIHRIKISAGGYGKALYLKHPNGTYTVYAHLKEFIEPVNKWVRKNQYNRETWEIELFPQPDIFEFKKGDIIGWSGNTGSSTAPHLHFEIRDANHKVLDPLRFGFPEIKDDRAPIFRKIAFKTLDIDSRVNGLFGRFTFDVIAQNGKYTLSKNIHLKGKIGIEIYAYDLFHGTRNRYGIPYLEGKIDDKPFFTHHIKTFSFGETRNLLVHTSYETMVKKAWRFNKLYVDDGNFLKFYEVEAEKGVLTVDDENPHDLEIYIQDVDQNDAVFFLPINHSSPSNIYANKDEYRLSPSYEILKNTLEVKIDNSLQQPESLTIYANRLQYFLSPSFRNKNEFHYLWDLRKGLPDSVGTTNDRVDLNLVAEVPPNNEFSYFSRDLDVYFPRYSLFDTLYLNVARYADPSFDEVFWLNHPYTPLRKNLVVTLKPRTDYADDPRAGVYSIGYAGRLSYVGGEWYNNEISFKTRSFRKFTIATDSIPPVIQPLRESRDVLRYMVNDAMSGLKSYEVLVNGEWVLMNYDYKKKIIWSEKLNPNIPFAGELKVVARDNAGNLSVYTNKI